jgi:hypothetical protein
MKVVPGALLRSSTESAAEHPLRGLLWVLVVIAVIQDDALDLRLTTGAVLCLSWLQDLDYLFSARATVGGVQHASDTAMIAQALWLPYWFWGALIAVISLCTWHSGCGSRHGRTGQGRSPCSVPLHCHQRTLISTRSWRPASSITVIW